MVNTDEPPVIPQNYHAQVAQLAQYSGEINYQQSNENQAYKRNTKKRMSKGQRKRVRTQKPRPIVVDDSAINEQESKSTNEQQTQA